MEGALSEGRFLVAYRSGTTLTGVLAVGMPPKELRRWRTAIGARADWQTQVASSVPPDSRYERG
ncbi:hypothetical protein ACYSUO_08610 [Streptomyces sp. UC4497]